MTEALVMVDREGNVTYWDESAEQFFGHPRADVIGKPIDRSSPKSSDSNTEMVCTVP